mmetsp:Transcript_528/g.1240  ORF Transcript_528/g.1240 Transcript_528/m.1240 type:complete len:108 (+) Transcript_528:287-610(+)
MSLIETKIQALVLNFIECLVEGEAYQLEIPRNNAALSNEKCQIRSFDSPATCRKYCQLMSIAALISEIDATSRHISQRDLYYSLKLLFKSQRGSSAHVSQFHNYLIS